MGDLERALGDVELVLELVLRLDLDLPTELGLGERGLGERGDLGDLGDRPRRLELPDRDLDERDADEVGDFFSPPP